MISAWNLIWIVPLCGSIGYALATIMIASKSENR